MAFDIGQTSSSVFGIVGMGIGLGVLAGTARMVMRSTERMYDGGYRRPSRYAPRYKTQRSDFYNPYTSNIKIKIPRW